MAVATLTPQPNAGYCPECGAEANGFMTRVGTSTVYARFCVSCKHIEQIDIGIVGNRTLGEPAKTEKAFSVVTPPLNDEAVIAQRDRAILLLERLMALVSPASFGPESAWETLHEANALLAEHGRGTPDRFAAARAAGFVTREKAGR